MDNNKAKGAAVFIVIIGTVIGLTRACWPDRELAARRDFAQQYTCPAGEVVAEPLEGPSVYEREMARIAAQEPPSTLNGDPKRIAMWQDEQQRSVRWARRHEDFQVSGCGVSTTLRCSCPGIGSSNIAQRACICSPVKP